MFRSLLTGLLTLAFAAAATAQTTPATTATSSTTVTRKTTKPARTTATTRQTSTKRVGNAKAPKTITVNRKPATSAPEPPAGRGQGVYAAPGEPVNVQDGPVQGYDGPAAKKVKSQTTMGAK